MNKELWYAVNGDGFGCTFTTYPVRDDHRKVWLGEVTHPYYSLVADMESEGLIILPPLKWSDDPVKLTLSLTVSSDD